MPRNSASAARRRAPSTSGSSGRTGATTLGDASSASGGGGVKRMPRGGHILASPALHGDEPLAHLGIHGKRRVRAGSGRDILGCSSSLHEGASSRGGPYTRSSHVD